MSKRTNIRRPNPEGWLAIQSFFCSSQDNTSTHAKLIKQLRQEYDKIPLQEFFTYYIRCLKVLFKIGEKHLTVERALDFGAKFAVSLYNVNNAENSSVEDEEEEMPVFVKELFNWLFSIHQTKDQSVRFRVCQFINKLLHNLGEEASLDDELCEKICTNMLERLQDRVSTVRAQAVMALQRLQDPTTSECPIIKAYLFHLSADPSASVRRSVLTCIGRTNVTLPHILERTRDVKDTVRKHAYLILTKINIRSLTIKQRERLLREGLKDRSEIVSSYVSSSLLPVWLRNMKGNYMDLLHALDVENSTETSILALEKLFKHRPITELVETVAEQQVNKLIPLDKLTPENALFWRCLAQHLHEKEEEHVDDLEAIIPELTPYCQYIKSYLTQRPKDNSSWYEIQRQFVVSQLLELSKVFDLADEMGRSNLKKLMFDLLTSPHVKEGLVPVIVEILVSVDPNVSSRLQFLAETVSEVHEPMTQVSVEPSAEEVRRKQVMEAKIKVQLNEIREEQETAVREQDFLRAQTLVEKLRELQEQFQKLSAESEIVHKEIRTECNDRATLAKCLTIIYEMMQSPTVTKLTPQLRSLMENFVMQLIEDCDTYIRSLALRAISVFCLLDQELAKQYILMFFFQLANNETNDEVCLIALRAIFDMFHLYGLQPFQMEDEEPNKEADKTGKKKLFDATGLDDEDDPDTENSQSAAMNGNSNNFISILTSLLDSMSADMRTIAAEGLCRLLLASRIKSPTLVSRLLIMWYNPITEGDIYLRQMLAAFFTTFASSHSWAQESLEQAFLPTLRTLFDAPHTSPLVEIDQDGVVRLLLNLTRPGFNPKAAQYNVHNNLAIALCNEVLVDENPYNVQVLLRALTQLDLVLDDAINIQSLSTLAEKVAETLKDRASLRHIHKFQQMLIGAERTQTTNRTETNTEASTNTDQQLDDREETVIRSSIEDDSEDDEPRLHPVTPFSKTQKRVIPETPDNSDSSSSEKSTEDVYPSDIGQFDGEITAQTPISKSSSHFKSPDVHSSKKRTRDGKPAGHKSVTPSSSELRKTRRSGGKLEGVPPLKISESKKRGGQKLISSSTASNRKQNEVTTTVQEQSDRSCSESRRARKSTNEHNLDKRNSVTSLKTPSESKKHAGQKHASSDTTLSNNKQNETTTSAQEQTEMPHSELRRSARKSTNDHSLNRTDHGAEIVLKKHGQNKKSHDTDPSNKRNHSVTLVQEQTVKSASESRKSSSTSDSSNKEKPKDRSPLKTPSEPRKHGQDHDSVISSNKGQNNSAKSVRKETEKPFPEMRRSTRRMNDARSSELGVTPLKTPESKKPGKNHTSNDSNTSNRGQRNVSKSAQKQADKPSSELRRSARKSNGGDLVGITPLNTPSNPKKSGQRKSHEIQTATSTQALLQSSVIDQHSIQQECADTNKVKSPIPHSDLRRSGRNRKSFDTSLELRSSHRDRNTPLERRYSIPVQISAERPRSESRKRGRNTSPDALSGKEQTPSKKTSPELNSQKSGDISSRNQDGKTPVQKQVDHTPFELRKRRRKRMSAGKEIPETVVSLLPESNKTISEMKNSHRSNDTRSVEKGLKTPVKKSTFELKNTQNHKSPHTSRKKQSEVQVSAKRTPSEIRRTSRRMVDTLSLDRGLRRNSGFLDAHSRKLNETPDKRTALERSSQKSRSVRSLDRSRSIAKSSAQTSADRGRSGLRKRLQNHKSPATPSIREKSRAAAISPAGSPTSKSGRILKPKERLDL